MPNPFRSLKSRATMEVNGAHAHHLKAADINTEGIRSALAFADAAVGIAESHHAMLDGLHSIAVMVQGHLQDGTTIPDYLVEALATAVGHINLDELGANVAQVRSQVTDLQRTV